MTRDIAFAVNVDPEMVGEVDPLAIVAAIVSILAAWIAARMARKAVVGLAARFEGLQPEHAKLAGRIAQYFILFLGIGIALSFLGAELQPLIAAVILIAVILSLALRGIAENFAAGIILQTRRPIQAGDEIDSLGFNGVVRDINGRTVVVDTFDGRRVHLPNSEVLTNPLVNDTSHGARRSEIEVRVASSDVTAVLDQLRRTTASADGVFTDPEPTVFVTAVDPDRVTTLVRFWHEPSESRPVTSEVIRQIVSSGIGDVALSSAIPPTPLTPPASL